MNAVAQSHVPRILTGVLLVQLAAFYGFSRGEHIPQAKPLSDFSIGASPWAPVKDEPLDQETLDVLKADDTLSRIYVNRQTGRAIQLFIAYFSTQRTGKTPHSPKNCLPGSGWVQNEAGTLTVAMQGQDHPITINRYLVSRDQAQSVVLYWYQSHNRIVASEYQAKLFTVLDSIRYRRSDTALVRIVAPVVNSHTSAATNAAMSFIQSLFAPLSAYLPA